MWGKNGDIPSRVAFGTDEATSRDALLKKSRLANHFLLTGRIKRWGRLPPRSLIDRGGQLLAALRHLEKVSKK
jgi:hypothetical protein